MRSPTANVSKFADSQFSLHFRPPRTGRNPKTGDAVALPGKHVPHFKPAGTARARQLGDSPANGRLIGSSGQLKIQSVSAKLGPRPEPNHMRLIRCWLHCLVSPLGSPSAHSTRNPSRWTLASPLSKRRWASASCWPCWPRPDRRHGDQRQRGIALARRLALAARRDSVPANKLEGVERGVLDQWFWFVLLLPWRL